MQVEITQTTFKPGKARTPTLLKRGTVLELEDAAAKELIELGRAVALGAEKKGKKKDPADA